MRLSAGCPCRSFKSPRRWLEAAYCFSVKCFPSRTSDVPDRHLFLEYENVALLGERLVIAKFIALGLQTIISFWKYYSDTLEWFFWAKTPLGLVISVEPHLILPVSSAYSKWHKTILQFSSVLTNNSCLKYILNPAIHKWFLVFTFIFMFFFLLENNKNEHLCT